MVKNLKTHLQLLLHSAEEMTTMNALQTQSNCNSHRGRSRERVQFHCGAYFVVDSITVYKATEAPQMCIVNSLKLHGPIFQNSV